MAIPNTRVRTTRGMKIVVGGRTVGLIKSFNVNQDMTVAREFEINADSDGNAVELVPGNLDAHSATINRSDLYSQWLEEAFGMADPSMLSNQAEPFEIHEIYKKPDGSIDGFRHIGCWISSMSRDCPSDGARIVMRNATVQILRSFRISE